MSLSKHFVFKFALSLALLPMLLAAALSAQTNLTLHGAVSDPLGNVISGADVSIQQNTQTVSKTKSGPDGSFEISVPTDGSYSAHVKAAGFAAQTIQLSGKNSNIADLNITLHISSLNQEVVVSATGTATPEAQVGASVSLIDSNQISTLDKLDVLENLRFVPGAQVVQTGQRGGTTSLFIRGGEPDFNKVIVDGIPANSLGGGFDFAQLSNSGVDSIEILRGANSVLYGSDALAGVVIITSKHGPTITPELKYSVDGGNFGTLNQNVSLGDLVQKFDYFSEFSRFDTRGSEPNDFFHNATVLGNLGWYSNPTTGIRTTFRRTTTDLGIPNALLFFGIPDDSTQTNQNLYTGITAQHQTTERWHNLAQFAYGEFASNYVNPSPTGQLYNSQVEGPVYLGNIVTIHGANGFNVTGQGILDFGGTYPMIFQSYEARRSIYAQSDYQFFGDWTGVAGFRYEHEDGEQITRNNYSSFLESHGNVAHRLFVTAGVGLEQNAVFGFAATPRVSLAYYLRQPSGSKFLSNTKLKFNFGKGIEEPSTSQQASSLSDLLTPEQVVQLHVAPIGPQRSQTTDFGIEQGLWYGRASLGATFFYNRFYDLISFLSIPELVAIGVPPDVAQGTPIGGAYVNASSERAFGTELEGKIDLSRGLVFQGQYTYLDAVTTRAFGDPSFNPAFPDIPIGAFAPLVGARPFRLAPHSASLMFIYTHRNFTAAFNGSLIGRRDDSTFLSDGDGGDSLLLPNRNLLPGYEKFDLSGGYTINSFIRVYTSIENLFSQHYQAVFGFPATPFTIRSGLTFMLDGGEKWWK